jgi:hypothetical protein
MLRRRSIIAGALFRAEMQRRGEVLLFLHRYTRQSGYGFEILFLSLFILFIDVKFSAPLRPLRNKCTFISQVA